MRLVQHAGRDQKSQPGNHPDGSAGEVGLEDGTKHNGQSALPRPPTLSGHDQRSGQWDGERRAAQLQSGRLHHRRGGRLPFEDAEGPDFCSTV